LAAPSHDDKIHNLRKTAALDDWRVALKTDHDRATKSAKGVRYEQASAFGYAGFLFGNRPPEDCT
jgi:hypothetical protein